MNRSVFDEELSEVDDIGFVAHIKNMPRSRGTRKSSHRTPVVPKPVEQPAPAPAEEDTFEMTYKAARHEAIWLRESLEFFHEQKWFDDVLRMVKGGKEASVYLCEGNATTGYDLLAAKVYRPRRFRNLKNDFLYREGRSNLDDSGRNITNKGMLHAMRKRTEYGRELLHTSWLEHEHQTLELLHKAGADVPRPFASGSNAILMEYFGDDVMSAPTLNEVELEAGEIRILFERVLHNIDLMLSHDRIHADLSAFNILYWEGDIVLIDFPQAIHPQQNSSAFPIFERDVVRVCEYFQRFGVRHKGARINPRQIAADLWAKYNNRFIPEVDPKMLGEDDDAERSIWESLKNT